MRPAFVFSIVLLFLASAVDASPSWSQIAITASPLDAPKVVAAADAMMSSEVGKTFPGRLLLLVNVADGDNPATHSFVPIYASMAEREAFVQKLQSDAAWATFQKAMGGVSQPVGAVLYTTLRSWGEASDDDVVWMGYAFDVSEPAAFVQALDAFMASETGKEFPGQVHLSAVQAAGMSPESHTISVGFASEAEMETWNDGLRGNADWEAYLAASDASSEYLGATFQRTLKAWGEASLADLSAE